MQMYGVTLTGKTPVMWHRDNIEFQAQVRRWQRDPNNHGQSVPGDDRAPAWTWIGSLYHDGKTLAMPSDSLMASCMGAGANMSTGKGRKTFKAQTQSGMSFTEPFLKFSCQGKAIDTASIFALQAESDFDQHLLRARELGFALDVRPVRPAGANGRHIRVRPCFEKWQVEGTLSVWDAALTKEVLDQLFTIAGDTHGIGEWRPSSKRPGPFGRFGAVVTKL